MIAKLRTSRTTALAEPMHGDSRLPTPYAAVARMQPAPSAEAESTRRKLRKRVILGNAVAWVAIIVAARLIFFS